jgi:putative RNA 2'-phosphotransferase
MLDSSRRLVRVSKYLSLILRHRPHDLGLTLDQGGWVPVDALLQASAAKGFAISQTELAQVVAESDKQRFAFSQDGTRIRANQGHSVPVDLELEPVEPPPVLYHGTGEKSVQTILAQGLRKMNRHHVHLSGDTDTARKVGARHGRPVIFEVDAAGMTRAGHTFYRSANGVWLVDAVPAAYLSQRA